MPQVPIYAPDQVQTAPLQGGYAPNVQVGTGWELAGKGLAELGGALGVEAIRERRRELQTQAFTTETKITQDWLNWDREARKTYRGVNVEGYQPAAKAWWEETARQYQGKLDPEAQRAVDRALMQKQTQALAGVLSFSDTEREATADATANADIATTIQFGAAHNQPDIAVGRVNEIISETGARKGWSTEQVEAAKLKALGDMHSTMVSKMLAGGDLKSAETYYKDHVDEIPFAEQDNLTKALASAKGQDGGYPKHSDQKLHAYLWSMIAANDTEGFLKATENLPQYMNRLAQPDFEQFAAKRQSLVAGGQQGDALLTDMERVNTALRNNGIDPTKDKDKAALISAEVDRRWRAASAEKNGAKLSQDEKQSLVDEVVMNKVFVPVWGEDKQVPLALAPRDKDGKFQDDLYVTVDGKDYKLSAVPASDRAEIIRARRARGLPISEQDIMNTYVRAKMGR